ncbi:hypothetical protein AGOR_G00251430 [Albula goreensis]|uniref:Laminin G domain-containing protein n=1 Tax=Albula goreensis TaxID=1534307 RepID=A0A8T3CC70_9TELE|nr:hypothetical protein AGOR_G00251430 [Albula goreensis]
MIAKGIMSFSATEWVILLLAVAKVHASTDGGQPESADTGSGMPLTEEVDLLEQLFWQAGNSSNTSITLEGQKCPVLQVGQYSTLSLPLRQAFGSRFADEFSILLQLRSSQREDRSLLTLLSPHSHILLQLRLSPYTFSLVTTQQRHYEFPVGALSDGQWHRVSVGVSTQRLALYVDCMLVESVNWTYPGMDIATDGLLMVGGIIEDFETPFEGSLRQVSFLMGDPDGARDQCTLHVPTCGGAAPKAPRSPKTPGSLEDLILASNDLEDLLKNSESSIGSRGPLTVSVTAPVRSHATLSHTQKKPADMCRDVPVPSLWSLMQGPPPVSNIILF